MNLNNISNINNGYINNASGVNAYKENSLHSVKNGSRLSEEKTDVVSISSNANAYREVNAKTNEISEEVKNYASAERIQGIKTKIENGTYAVSTGVVADSILAHMLFWNAGGGIFGWLQ